MTDSPIVSRLRDLVKEYDHPVYRGNGYAEGIAAAAKHALELAPRNETVVTRDQVRPGDYVIWEMAWTVNGVSFVRRREGIAHHRNTQGEWFTEESMMITDGEGLGITITARRFPIWVRQNRPKPPVDQRHYFIYARDHRRPRVWWSSYYGCWAVTDGLGTYFYDSWPEAIEAACRAV